MHGKRKLGGVHPGRPPDYIQGQIGGFVLHKLYHLTISVR